jgi:hypothetical protein
MPDRNPTLGFEFETVRKKGTNIPLPLPPSDHSMLLVPVQKKIIHR